MFNPISADNSFLNIIPIRFIDVIILDIPSNRQVLSLIFALLKISQNLSTVWASTRDIGAHRVVEQLGHRRARANAQTHQSLRCSHIQNMGVDVDSYQNL